MEIIKTIFAWIWANIFDISLVVVGASAFITYILQMKNERKTAAALIIEQVNSVEKIIEDLKNTYEHNNKTLDDNSVYLSREVEYDGAWSAYKHLMIKQLSHSEFDLVQKFFDSAYQIEKTRSDIIYCFKLSWNNKSLVTQLINGKFNDPTYVIPPTFTLPNTNNAQLIDMFINANSNNRGFNPKISYDGLYAELNNYFPLSGTTAYDKLSKIAKKK